MEFYHNGLLTWMDDLPAIAWIQVTKQHTSNSDGLLITVLISGMYVAPVGVMNTYI